MSTASVEDGSTGNAIKDAVATSVAGTGSDGPIVTVTGNVAARYGDDVLVALVKCKKEEYDGYYLVKNATHAAGTTTIEFYGTNGTALPADLPFCSKDLAATANVVDADTKIQRVKVSALATSGSGAGKALTDAGGAIAAGELAILKNCLSKATAVGSWVKVGDTSGVTIQETYDNGNGTLATAAGSAKPLAITLGQDGSGVTIDGSGGVKGKFLVGNTNAVKEILLKSDLNNADAIILQAVNAAGEIHLKQQGNSELKVQANIVTARKDLTIGQNLSVTGTSDLNGVTAAGDITFDTAASHQKIEKAAGVNDKNLGIEYSGAGALKILSTGSQAAGGLWIEGQAAATKMVVQAHNDAEIRMGNAAADTQIKMLFDGSTAANEVLTIESAGTRAANNQGALELKTSGGLFMESTSTDANGYYSKAAGIMNLVSTKASADAIKIEATAADSTVAVRVNGADKLKASATDVSTTVTFKPNDVAINGNKFTVSNAGVTSIQGAVTVGASGGSAGVDLTANGNTNNSLFKWDQASNTVLLTGAALTQTGAGVVAFTGEVRSSAAAALTFNSAAAAQQTIERVANADDKGLNIFLTGNQDTLMDIKAEGNTDLAMRFNTPNGGIKAVAKGKIELNSNKADVNAITLVNQNAGGGIDIDAKSAGFDLLSTGLVNLVSSSNSQDFTIQHTGTAGKDLKVICVDGSVKMQSGEADAAAISIQATAAASGMDLDCGSAGFNLLSTGGAVSITGQSGATIATTIADSDITIQAAGGGTNNITLNSAGNEANAIDLNATVGGITADAAAAIALTAGTTLTTASTGNTLCTAVAYEVNASGKLTLDGGKNAANAVHIVSDDTAGGVRIESKGGGINGTSTAGGSIQFNATQAASQFTVASAADAQDLKIEVTGATDSSVLVLSSGTSATEAIKMHSSAGGIELTAAAKYSVDATAEATIIGQHASDDAILFRASNAAGAIKAQVGGNGAANVEHLTRVDAFVVRSKYIEMEKKTHGRQNAEANYPVQTNKNLKVEKQLDQGMIVFIGHDEEAIETAGGGSGETVVYKACQQNGNTDSDKGNAGSMRPMGVLMEDSDGSNWVEKKVCMVPGSLVPMKFAGGNPVIDDIGKAVFMSATKGCVTKTAPSTAGEVWVVGYIASIANVSVGVYMCIFQPSFRSLIRT